MQLGEVIAPPRSNLDFSRPESLRQVVRDADAKIIVNAAAYTAVDKAEREESLAHLINAVAPSVLADEAACSNALLVHYSTAYIFDGEKSEPYLEDDEPNPINAYGRTKIAGEQKILGSGCQHLILRTNWIYSSRGQNFARTILSLAKLGEEIRVVTDQIGAPTPAGLIADLTAKMLERLTSPKNPPIPELSGIFNLTSSGYTSWHGFAQILLEVGDVHRPKATQKSTLVPISSDQFLLPAKRPKNSRLNCDKLTARFGLKVPHWESLARICVNEIEEHNAH